ncbi:kinesin light chain 3, partial [Pyrenophora tritici-repentis]
QLVKRCVVEIGARHCLLIFDNTEHINWRSSGSSTTEAADLANCLPQSKLCSVIFTTTNTDTAQALDPQNIISLRELTLDAALKMLQVRLARPLANTEQQEAEHLLRALSYLPLAVIQAAACIKASGMTVQEYRSRMDNHKKLAIEHSGDLSEANLASTYWNQGRWNDAEKLEVQVMEIRKTKLGASHPDTLNSMANLALTYWNQGRWDDAEKLNVQVMETRKTKLGADHPSTLTSIANLASTYWNQGRWDDAEKLNLQVMETRKTKLGADHLDTLTSIANLASTYRNQGRWDDAEKLFVQVMETRKTELGADHRSTLTSMANLASTYRNQGRWNDAEKLE